MQVCNLLCQVNHISGTLSRPPGRLLLLEKPLRLLFAVACSVCVGGCSDLDHVSDIVLLCLCTCVCVCVCVCWWVCFCEKGGWD